MTCIPLRLQVFFIKRRGLVLHGMEAVEVRVPVLYSQLLPK